MQIVYAQYANITQKRLRSNYAEKLGFTQFYYSEITQKKLRRNYANHTTITQIHYADNTQINHANHYADYYRDAVITQIIMQIRLRNSPKSDYAYYANTDFRYAEISSWIITQWATC